MTTYNLYQLTKNASKLDYNDIGINPNLEKCLELKVAVPVKKLNNRTQKVIGNSKYILCLYNYDCLNKYRKAGYTLCGDCRK